MMVIEREDYLEKLLRRRKNGLVKIVTGIRRCGKSYLLNTLFRNRLRAEGVEDSHIVQVALDDIANKALRDADALYRHVTGLIVDKSDYYVLLDEIQLVDGFEDVLNGFLHLPNVDVYVTGSNSRFLSSDIVTGFRGRGDEIRVRPLSFAEYFPFHGGAEERAWEDYVYYGGLPYTLALPEPEDKEDYLRSLFRMVYLSDIVERHGVRNPQELDELLDVLSSSVGSLTNPLKLSRTFRSVKGKTISDNTIRKYIAHLEDAFLLNEAKRYDVKGRKYIGSSLKYYFEDMGLRNARLNFRQVEENHVMENIVHNELVRRGFSVDVGVVQTYGKGENGKTAKRPLEIDFVATKGSRRYYVQSALNVDAAEKREQETRPFRNVGDSFKKILVVKGTARPRRNENGIVTMGVVPFLLDSGSLEL